MASRTIGAVALISFLFTAVVLADDSRVVVANVESVEQGKVVHLQWSAPASQITSLAVWNPSVGAFPLSIDAAIKIARDRLIKSFPAVKEWKLDELLLMEIKNDGKSVPDIRERYYYLVYLLPRSDQEAKKIEESEKGELSFYEVILSNGSSLEPQVKVGGN